MPQSPLPPASPLLPPSISGGGGGETAEAHAVYDRYLTGYNISNGTGVRSSTLIDRTFNDDGGGCTVSIASGAVPIPDGAATVIIPAGTILTPTETCRDSFTYNIPVGHRLTLIGNFTATVASATITSIPREHPHSGVATGVTGTGFYCGRRYDWSEFAPDEARALFITASRVSLIGWVWVDADGQQIAHCTGHRPIFRPPGL